MVAVPVPVAVTLRRKVVGAVGALGTVVMDSSQDFCLPWFLLRRPQRLAVAVPQLRPLTVACQ